MRNKPKQNETDCHPCGAQGASKGNGVGRQERLDFSSEISEQITIIYEALQLAVEVYGGIDALAADSGKSATLTRLRVYRREDNKREIQKAHIDHLAIAVADPEARAQFINFLLDAWGYKPAELKREPTAEERLHAYEMALDAAGTVGVDIRRHAAKAGGWNPATKR